MVVAPFGNPLNLSNRDTLAGCAALALWAFLAPLARLALPLPPLLLTALGFAAGGLLGLIVVAARGRLALLRQPPLAWLHGVGGLAGFHALYFAALALAPPVEANLLNYTWPLLIVLLSAPLRGLPLGPRRLLGVALGAAGAALLLAGGARFPAEALAGFACAIAAAFTWALYSVLAGRLARVPTEAVAGFCLASAALTFVAHLAWESAAMPGPRQWLAVLLLGLGPMGAAFFLWDIGMKRGDPRLLGTLGYATPVASTLLLIALGEGAFTWQVAAATALVAGGGVLAARA
ncbi:EamA domain-containing membrane protein RarD [Belnapia rosea]|uniref:EamA domain-containing membrane protein RarD n=1 Tax=Belnapia rosea TaxID=938405 RepID=A0A1G6NWT8_9PROT|nr:EamA domain-containing membrane protein RarD [Belnapia rosea]